MQLYSPKSIANYFIDLAKARGERLSPMKLQKLVYYALGWYAGHTGRPLVDEPVEAWQYGPVIPSLYQEFRKFGSGQITERATELDDNFELREVPPPDDPNVRKFLDNVWSSYGHFTAIKLSDMTHAEGGPWDQTWSESLGVRGTDIPFERIKQYFQSAAEKAKAKARAAA